MAYLVGQILLWLVLAGLVGTAVGWFIRGASSGRGVRRVAKEWKERLDGVSAALRAQLEERNTEILTLRDALQERTDRAASMEDELTSRTTALNELQDIFDSMQARLSDLELQVKDRDEELGRLELESRAGVAEKSAEIAALGTRLEELEEVARGREQDRERIAELEGLLGEAERGALAQAARKDAAEEADDLSERAAADGALREQLEEREVHIRELESRLQELDERIRSMEPVQDQLESRDETLRDLEDDHRNVLMERDREIARLQARVEELEPLERQVRDQDAQIRLLQPLGGVIKERDERIRKLKEIHEAEVREKDVEIERLSTRIVEFEQLPLPPAGVPEFGGSGPDAPEPRAEARRLAGESRTLARGSRPLVPEVPDVDTESEDVVSHPPDSGPDTPDAAAIPDQDDLKEIVGIGPVLERALNELGYRTFRDVALWEKEDIARVKEMIGIFSKRMDRDDWVGQARALHARKYGGEPR